MSSPPGGAVGARLWRSGVMLMMLSALSLTIMTGFVKVARDELSSFEVMFWRGVISVPLVYLLARRGSIWIANKRVFMVRAAFGVCAMYCFFTAIKGLALADMSLIHKLQPILVALLAPLVLGRGEKGGWRLWLVLVAGVTGCAILLSPKVDVDLEPGLWALAATALSAGAHLCVRELGKTDRPSVIVMWFQVAVTLCALIGLLVTDGALPRAPTHLWPVLLGCGVFATVGQVLMTMAYRVERAPTVAAASYVGPLWALVGDVVFFAALPGSNALIGGAIIVAAGLWLVRSRARGAEPDASTYGS